jgi:hypothetical protein
MDAVDELEGEEGEESAGVPRLKPVEPMPRSVWARPIVGRSRLTRWSSGAPVLGWTGTTIGW